MLAAALTRLRCAHQEQRLDPVRMGLIRLCLNDLISKKEGEIQMSENLDSAQNHPAYLSGRLLAVYEGLQYAASEQQVNQTVTDRYFSLASTYPALAFPKLEDLGQKHLRKLRRDIRTRGAWVRIGEEIDRLHVEIERACGFRFPAALDLDGQGRFALGYHHQRARQMAEARARKAARQEISDSPENQEN
jgi:CRISPR-associated protein Csd1